MNLIRVIPNICILLISMLLNLTNPLNTIASVKASCSITVTTNISNETNIRQGVNKLIVTAVFPEKMQTSSVNVTFSTPISFAFNPVAPSVRWESDNSVCILEYTVRGLFSQTAYNVSAQIENAVAESSTVYSCESDPFSIDKVQPTCGIALDPATINIQEIEAGKTSFVVTITYSESMASSYSPDIAFDQDVSETLELDNASKSWIANNTFKASYPIKTNSQQRLQNIVVQVTGAQDLIGNTQMFQSAMFNILLTRASGNMSFSASPGTGANVINGTTSFVVQLDYSEEMKPSPTPVISFDPPVASTLTQTGDAWENGNKTYKVNYTVTSSTQNGTITASASSAEDLGGSPTGTITGSFIIDMVKPSSTIQVSPAKILADTEELTVTITYDETMLHSVMPVIDFPSGVTGILTFNSESWNDNNTQYTAKYSVSKNSVSTSGNITVTKAVDLAGNEQNTSTQAIIIDQRIPIINSIAMNPNNLVIGNTTAVLDINFDLEMDSNINPAVTFNPDLPAGLLTEQSRSWSGDKKTLTINYSFNDLINFKQSNISITVNNAVSTNGNSIQITTQNNIFSVDVLRPTCTEVTFAPDIIVDQTTSFNMFITYDSEMDTNVPPDIDFISSDNISTTVVLVSRTWQTNKRCMVNYTIYDQNQQVPEIYVKIKNARSISNNIQAEYTSPNYFSIDMKDIDATLSLNTTQVDCNNNLFTVTVTFNQDMTTTQENIIVFPDYDPQGAIVFESINWSNNKTAVVQYQVNHNIKSEASNTSIRIEPVDNSLGRTFPGKLFNSMFSVDIIPPQVSNSESVSPTCNNETDGYIHLQVSDGTTPYNYSWEKDGAAFGNNSNNQDNLSAGEYSVIITDSKQCYTGYSATLINPDPIQFTAKVLQNVERKDDGVILLDASGGTLPYTYYMNNTSLGNQNEVQNLPVGIYNFEVTDDNSCSAATTAEIKDYRTPTAFTPNNDGFNDIFMEGNKVKIFDRNGTSIYQGDNGWDGNYNGRTARPATYFYIVTFPDGTEKKGTVQIFKN